MDKNPLALIVLGFLIGLLILVVLFSIALYIELENLISMLKGSGSSFGFFYHSYDVIGNLITIQPLGRMLVVKINKTVPDFVYSLLKLDLKVYDLFSNTVEDVYINQGGTITVDCR